jgi:hypothetical protein
LRDNIRKIETYDATNAVGNSTGYSGALDYFNNTTVWGNAFVLKNFVINNVSQGWWFNSLADQQPDLYIKIKDGNNNIVYNGRNYKKSDTIPSLLAPIAIPLFVVLNNPPYVAELWDFDPVGGDDFGGSYPIISTSGNWTGNGNSGNYIVESINGNPAIDAHWGAEKSHDFFQDIFGRNGFDANGGLIKQYINIAGQPKDNAFASASATNNILGYGLGDGLSSNPWVALDLTGHEFSHLVVAYRQNLNTTLFHTSNDLRYQGESGALNESFADIFGTAIEFHTKPSTANWTLFEDLCLPFGAPESFIRSMSNPNSKEQPDTVNGTYWTSTAGVHTLSGVQNYWFYLLSQGSQSITNPVNDLGNPYSVTGIGISKARQIAYKNLTTYMPSNTSTYMDSYFGSLLAAQELYGNPSPEYSAVRNAWYAVGLGNNPNFSCSGTTNLTASSGTFTDGSNNANYGNNSTCKWVIAPAGATQISLNFTAFNTEALYDFVRVYNGPDDTFPLLGTYSGNTLPSTISTTAGIGAMCVKFTTDTSNTFSGWSANYTSLVTTPACTGLTKLTTPTGTFSDGSGSNNYTNNQQCLWYIAPPCATSVTLTFSTFNTELNFDGVAIYNSLTATTPIATYSGTSLPVSVTSTTGVMLVAFITDYSTSSQGFSASYTSTGSSFCSGTTTLNTADFGTISDGSGTNNYCNNSNCSWLIQPPNATSITLNFTAFDLEQPSTDGNSIYDVVEIYDGTSASATLLEKFTGSNIPQSVTSTGGSMFIKFTSDISDTFQGWSANYTSTQNSYCNASATTLTSPTGTFTDGSGVDKYANNSDCSWLIQPTNARSITLSFSAFDTELNYDGVIVFDGANSTAPVIGQFTGTTLPSSLTSTGGSMYVLFLSDETLRSNGWNANYNSSTLSSDNFELNGSIIIHPNPTSSKIFITSKEHVSSYEIYNALGQKVQEGNFNAVLEQEELDLTALQNGLYILNLKADNLNKTIKVIKQ